MILPGTLMSNGQAATLGVLGGGQLGRMFVHAAQRLGYRTAVLDPDPHSPAGQVSHQHIQTAYNDEQGLGELAQSCAAITTEFENVPATALQLLSAQVPVSPGAPAVAIAQDRMAEKAHFLSCGVACAPHTVIQTPADIASAPEHLLPGILKTARLGYDGKGQARVNTHAELAAAWQQQGQAPCVLEQRLTLQSECSVLIARGQDGTAVNFAPQRNWHQDGILALTAAYEGNMPVALANQSVSAAKSIADGLNYVGVLCVEFFVVDDGTEHGALLVNEIAPRPHNSAHYTQDACDQSQFDLQVRTLAGLPLHAPRQHSPAFMLNLLGDCWQNGTPDWAAVLALPGTHLHLYGKLHAKPGRKMGHLNITGPNVESVQATARAAARILGLKIDALAA